MDKIINLLTLKGPKERVTVILIGLITLWLMPINIIEDYNPCIYKMIFGNTNHYSHGITRAMSSFLKCNFSQAYKYNKLVYIVMGIIFAILFTDIIRLTKRIDI